MTNPVQLADALFNHIRDSILEDEAKSDEELKEEVQKAREKLADAFALTKDKVDSKNNRST